jgi:GDP-L-fucose synthase
MDKNSKIYIAGHNGLMGSALVRQLTKQGYNNVHTASSSNLDLRNQKLVNDYINYLKPEYVFICAGKVGGIGANVAEPASFIYDNLMIQANIIEASYKNNVKKLLALGSSCIYPRFSQQPIKEEYLLQGELEPTNEYYAVAKIAALKMCDAYRKQYKCDFISAMPTNLYGINDNYDLQNSHVLPALLRKVITAKSKNEEIEIWGTGTVKREFLYSEDCADACIFLMNNYSDYGHMNIGTGEDIELNELLSIICNEVGYKWKINHNLSKPDGMKQKKLDVSKINSLGWSASTSLKDGIKKTIESLDISKWI